MTVKRINKTKYLNDNYGGKWKYDGINTWICDDCTRTVSRVASCTCDYVCGHSPDYWLYGDGTPKPVYFWLTPHKQEKNDD
jgi:hypothetical protein